MATQVLFPHFSRITLVGYKQRHNSTLNINVVPTTSLSVVNNNLLDIAIEKLLWSRQVFAHLHFAYEILVLQELIMSGDHKTQIKGSPSQYVKLNVSGTLFYTTIGTLTKSDNMLRTMFSGRMEVLTDSEGWILIDRCGKHFGTILNYLRDGTVPLPESCTEIMELQAEAKYFLIEELTESCRQAIAKKEREAEPICRVPLITSQKEEQLLISSTSKPVVKLLINRHNNKYSYTSTSDDNLLKNIELFDKLSLRFSGRVLFIKDVIGSTEICCWSYYGHGKKVAEVCCTSIVYATDKKHTKVEFPEARIYEESLSILLYESRNGPDQDLIQATSSRGAVGGLSCTSDEEEERSGLARLRSNKQNNQS